MRSRRSGLEAAERPHVVQPVGQFHDDDPDVVDHRQQHFAIVLRLPVFGGAEVDLAELGDAIDAARHFFTEVLLNIRGGDAGVFDDVVQQAGLDADHIHAHLGQNLRHGERMHEVGLARIAQLALMILSREMESFLDRGEVVLGPGLANRLDQLLQFPGHFRLNCNPGSRCHISILELYERGLPRRVRRATLPGFGWPVSALSSFALSPCSHSHDGP